MHAAYKVCGVLDPRKVSRSLGGETHRRDLCQALPLRLPVHLVPVVQAIFSKQQNMLYFGYVAHNGSLVDLSVFVSDAVARLDSPSSCSSEASFQGNGNRKGLGWVVGLRLTLSLPHVL